MATNPSDATNILSGMNEAKFVKGRRKTVLYKYRSDIGLQICEILFYLGTKTDIEISGCRFYWYQFRIEIPKVYSRSESYEYTKCTKNESSSHIL